jgi:sulfate adenylyltransferase
MRQHDKSSVGRRGTGFLKLFSARRRVQSKLTPLKNDCMTFRAHSGRSEQGFVIFFTGLSGAGKSTIADSLAAKIVDERERAVTLLDGDAVRKHLSSELGFSRADRNTNIRRIGFVASEVAKHGGIAVCAAIAPFDEIRREIRTMAKAVGGFVLVYVSTPLSVCEKRDCKGMYAMARSGLIKQFTGVSDPYEVPTDAEITIDATCISPENAADKILNHLSECGFLAAHQHDAASIHRAR